MVEKVDENNSKKDDPLWLSAHEASRLTYEEVAEKLNVDTNTGLTEREAVKRRQFCGYNEFPIAEEDPLWQKYLEQFQNPLILLLLASAVVSGLMNQINDAISITIAILIVATVAFVQEFRSEQSLQALHKLVSPSCYCIRDNVRMTLAARELVPGDLVVLQVGDRIPADLRLYEAADLLIDESNFTGETEPSRKNSDANLIPIDASFRNQNVAFMGTLIRAGNAKGIVVSTGTNSEFGSVFKMMQEEQAPRTPLQKSMDNLGAQLSMVSLAIIAVIMFIGWWQGKPMLDMFQIGVSLAVAAIPEGLPIVVTVTLALGVMRMAKRNAIVKKLPTVETLGCVNVICTDKTGTLTKNEMTVTVLVTSDGYVAKLTGSGYNDNGQILITESQHPQKAKDSVSKLLEIGAVCNNALIKKDGTLMGQATDGALLAAAQKDGIYNTSDKYTRIKEYPFSSEHKLMAVKCVSKFDKEEVFFVKGAIERILTKCNSYNLNGATETMTPEKSENFLLEASEVAKKGLRVIGLAKGKSFENLTYMGVVGICDPPKPRVKDAVSILKESGVDVKMITGDAMDTAVAIAQSIGLHAKPLSGAELDSLTIDELDATVPEANVFYRVSPKNKLSIVKSLQRSGYIVGMTGDGVNDGVALKKADIGIAMGKNGTDVCKEAADTILVDDDFYTIIAAIEEGKSIFHNIRNFVGFQLSTSIAALGLVALSTLMDIPTPLNAMQILWINIIMDGPPAQSLGVEPVTKDVIKQKSRDVKEPMITNKLIANILMSAVIILGGTMWVFTKEMTSDGVTERDTTMAFTCFVFFDMWNALSYRSQTKSVFNIGLLKNTFFLIAVGLSVLGQLLVIYAPPLQFVFQTETLSAKDMAFLVAVSSTVWIFSEARKAFERFVEKN